MLASHVSPALLPFANQPGAVGLSNGLSLFALAALAWLLTYALHFFRELLVLIATGNENLRLPPEELKTARNMRNIFSIEKIEKIAVLLSDVFTHVERNANPKILFLDTGIQMNKIMKGV